VAAACWLSLGARAAPPPSGEQIDKLIEQLDAERFTQREEASKKLTAMGRAVVRPLRKALAAGGLSLEAASRAKAVLNKVYVPPHGAVWRSSASAEPPEGFRDGDVVVEAAGRPVWSQDALTDAVLPRREVELTVWRKDKGRFKTTAAFAEQALRRMRTYPDELGLFEQLGRKGPWERDVRSALDMLYNGNPKCLGLLEGAWKAGCRDAVVLTAWIGGLLDAGKHREGLKVAAREAAKAEGGRPGGCGLHGLLPCMVAKAQRMGGQRAEALATLEAAVKRASGAKASRGLSLLRGAQVRILASGSPEAAVKLLRDCLKRSDPVDLPAAAVREAAEAMTAGGDPNDVLAFLELLKESPAAERLREAYERQVPLAAKHRARKDRRPTAVLVRWRRGLIATGTMGRVTHMYFPLEEMPAPCRIECEMKLDAHPEEWSGYTSAVGMDLRTPGIRQPGIRQPGMRRPGERLAEVAVDRFGRGRIWSALSALPGNSSAFAGSASQWRKVAIDLRPDYVRFWIDGRAVRTWYGEWPSDLKQVSPSVRVSNGRALFRNVKDYVFTAADVDGGQVEAAMTNMHQAMLAADRRAAAEHHRKLQDLWAKVPEAKPFVDAARLAMDLHERLFSPEGLEVCTAGLLMDPAVRKVGTWQLDEGWLMGTSIKPRRKAVFDLPVLTGDIEITGLLDMVKGGPEGELLILWDGQSVHWARSHPNAGTPHMKYLPPYAKIYVGGWWDREKGKKIPGEPPLGPMPFCLRIRGDKVALFAKDPAKPIIFFSGVRRNPAWFSLMSFLDGPDGKAKYGRIVIRHLPKDKDLRAPAELPKAGP